MNQEAVTNGFNGIFRGFRVGIDPRRERSFDGWIDDVNVYTEALSSAQIQKLYAQGREKHKITSD